MPGSRTPRLSRSIRPVRSPSSLAAEASTLAEPIMLTRIVVTGLLITVSIPAIAAQWTMWECPNIAESRSSGERMSPRTICRFGWSRNPDVDRASRVKLSKTVTTLSSSSRPAMVEPMNPAPPVTKIRLFVNMVWSSSSWSEERGPPTDERIQSASRGCARSGMRSDAAPGSFPNAGQHRVEPGPADRRPGQLGLDEPAAGGAEAFGGSRVADEFAHCLGDLLGIVVDD